MKDFVIFDVDGTLLSDRNRLKRSTLEGIKGLRKKDIPFSIASGRSFPLCRSLARKLGVSGHIITCNGALVQDVYSGKVLYKKLLPASIAAQVIEDLTNLQEVNVYLTFPTEIIAPTSNQTIWKSRASFPIKIVDRLQEQNLKDLVKITLEFFDRELISQTVNHFRQKYKDSINVVQSDERAIDITAFKSNKGESLTILAKSLNAKTVYAFGNQQNDIEMLQYADVGIAMKNADEKLKSIADYVTLSNNEDGIFTALKHFKLI